MKDYKLDFQSELPVEFANEFKVCGHMMHGTNRSTEFGEC